MNIKDIKNNENRKTTNNLTRSVLLVALIACLAGTMIACSSSKKMPDKAPTSRDAIKVLSEYTDADDSELEIIYGDSDYGRFLLDNYSYSEAVIYTSNDNEFAFMLIEFKNEDDAEDYYEEKLEVYDTLLDDDYIDENDENTIISEHEPENSDELYGYLFASEEDEVILSIYWIGETVITVNTEEDYYEDAIAIIEALELPSA